MIFYRCYCRCTSPLCNSFTECIPQHYQSPIRQISSPCGFLLKLFEHCLKSWASFGKKLAWVFWDTGKVVDDTVKMLLFAVSFNYTLVKQSKQPFLPLKIRRSTWPTIKVHLPSCDDDQLLGPLKGGLPCPSLSDGIRLRADGTRATLGEVWPDGDSGVSSTKRNNKGIILVNIACY